MRSLLGPGREKGKELGKEKEGERERERMRGRHTAELFDLNRRQPRERVPCKFMPDWEQGRKDGGEGKSWPTVEGVRCRHHSKRLDARKEVVDD